MEGGGAIVWGIVGGLSKGRVWSWMVLGYGVSCSAL